MKKNTYNSRAELVKAFENDPTATVSKITPATQGKQVTIKFEGYTYSLVNTTGEKWKREKYVKQLMEKVFARYGL